MAGETVLVGALSHETNTFAAVTSETGRDAFEQRQEYFGEDVLTELRDTNTAICGIIEVAEREGVDLVPTIAAMANPGYFVTTDAYEFYTGRIVNAVREHAADLDGVALALHGAMVTEEFEDGEGPLVASVREHVGPDVPIVVTLDLHGNVTDELVAAADALVAYETYPHVDIRDTGKTGMDLLVRAMNGDVDPTMHVERPPVLASGPMQSTRDGPMAAVMDRARELEARPSVQKVSVLPGFYPADTPDTGFSIPVVADGDPDVARDVARDLARFVWETRSEFVADFPGPPKAVSETKERLRSRDESDRPIVLADVGDNPGGGGTADGTTLLRALLDQEVANAGFAIICDPETVAQCIRAGVGERVAVSLGGKTDARFGSPVELDGYVKTITDGEFVNTGPMSTGIRRHLGRTVRLECGTDDSVSVIVTENRVQPMDTEIWRHVGIQPERLDVIVVKSTNHYRADYEPIASHVVPVDSPGLFAMNPRTFEYEHLRRPMFPLDRMADDAYPDW